MREVEAKILEIDPAATRAKLLGLGAEPVFEGSVESVFLRNERGDKLRLRRMGGECFLTHKTPLPSAAAKSNDERETRISDTAEMEEILVRSGFEVYARTKKHRESYRLGAARYEIDSLPDMPPYLEIEAESEETLHEAIKRIGYAASDAVAMSEREVKERYGLPT